MAIFMQNTSPRSVTVLSRQSRRIMCINRKYRKAVLRAELSAQADCPKTWANV